jgi:hypothetical protein
VHRAERGQGYVYELLYDGDGSRAPHLFGLLDAAALGGYDSQRSGSQVARSAPGRAEVGAMSVPGRDVLLPGKPVAARVAAEGEPFAAAATHPGVNGHAQVVTVAAGEA